MPLPPKRATQPESSMRLIKLLLTAVITLTALQFLPPVNAQPKPSADAAKRLHAFFEEEWNYEMEQNPTQASSLGDRRWNDRWGDRSLEAMRKRDEHTVAALARLTKIDRAQLSPADQLNYDLFKKDLETDIEGAKFRLYLMPINQRGGPQTLDELGDRLRFETVKDYEDWVARLRAFPVLIDQQIALMREGARTRMMWPKIVLSRVPAQIDKQLVSKPEESPFYKPFTKFPAAIAAAERERLTKAASECDRFRSPPLLPEAENIFCRRIPPGGFRRGRRLANAAGNGALRSSDATAYDDGAESAANSRERSE